MKLKKGSTKYVIVFLITLVAFLSAFPVSFAAAISHPDDPVPIPIPIKPRPGIRWLSYPSSAVDISGEVYLAWRTTNFKSKQTVYLQRALIGGTVYENIVSYYAPIGDKSVCFYDSPEYIGKYSYRIYASRDRIYSSTRTVTIQLTMTPGAGWTQDSYEWGTGVAVEEADGTKKTFQIYARDCWGIYDDKKGIATAEILSPEFALYGGISYKFKWSWDFRGEAESNGAEWLFRVIYSLYQGEDYYSLGSWETQTEQEWNVETNGPGEQYSKTYSAPVTGSFKVMGGAGIICTYLTSIPSDVATVDFYTGGRIIYLNQVQIIPA
jgi:hypothetical protein